MTRRGAPSWRLIASVVITWSAMVGVPGAFGARLVFQGGPVVPLPEVPLQVAPIHLDGDGRLDFVVLANGPGVNDGILRPYTQLPNGAFTPGLTRAVGARAHMMAVGDMNRDGRDDLVVSGLEAQSVGPIPPLYFEEITVFLGDGAGTVIPAGTHRTLGTQTSNLRIALGHLSGDADLDVLTGERASQELGPVFGDGQGGIGTPGSMAIWSEIVDGLTNVALGRLDGDATNDFVLAARTGLSVRLRGGIASAVNVGLNGTPSVVTIADLTQDQHADVVASLPGSGVNTLQVLLGAGGGALRAATGYDGGPNPVLAPSFADLNGDGYPDPVMANTTSTTVTVLPTSGTGGFESPEAFPVGIQPVGTAVGDINGDGRPDLVTANAMTPNVAILFNTTPFPGPGVQTGAAGSVRATSATITGSVTPRGRSGTYYVEYGTTAAYGRTSSPAALPAGVTPTPIAAGVSGLAPRTTYHYRLVATDRYGTTTGADGVFTTSGITGLTNAEFAAKWRQSRVIGNLRLEGTSDRAAQLTVVLRRAGQTKPGLNRVVPLTPGVFRSDLRLPPELHPGAYELVLTAPDDAGAPATETRLLVLPAPPEGYLRRAYASRKLGGAATTRIRKRPAIVYATFRFLVRPRPGSRITVEWVRPGSRRATRRERKPYLPVISSFAGSISGTPLRAGVWRCIIRANGVIVGQTSVRIG